MKGQVAIPQTSDELEELLHDDDRLTGILAAGQLPEFVRAYQTAALGNTKAELGAQMREQLQLGMQEFLQDQEGKGFKPGQSAAPGLAGRDARKAAAIARSTLPDARAQVEKNKLFSAKAMGACVDDESYSASMHAFMNACFLAEKQARDAGNADEITRIQDYKTKLHNALAERIPSEGGFLVPENLRSEILMVALETAVVRPRARIIPMDSLRVPLPAIDDTSHAGSNGVYGGVIGYWAEEGAALTASQPSFQRFVLEARKLTAYTTIPNELLQDSVVSLDQWFSMFFPKAISWFEDNAFIAGTGAGEPQGFLNAPGAIKLTTSTANEIKWSHIASAYSRMWPASLSSAVWICSPDTLASLLQMAMNDLTNTSTSVAPPLWLTAMQSLDYPGGGNGDGVNYRLMGRPLIVSEKMPSTLSGNTATAGALTFVDLSYYLIGDRMSLQIASSDQYLFAQDLMAYRIIERLDGRFWLQSPITPAGAGASTLSPLVLINTAG